MTPEQKTEYTKHPVDVAVRDLRQDLDELKRGYYHILDWSSTLSNSLDALQERVEARDAEPVAAEPLNKNLRPDSKITEDVLSQEKRANEKAAWADRETIQALRKLRQDDAEKMQVERKEASRELAKYRDWYVGARAEATDLAQKLVAMRGAQSEREAQWRVEEEAFRTKIGGQEAELERKAEELNKVSHQGWNVIVDLQRAAWREAELEEKLRKATATTLDTCTGDGARVRVDCTGPKIAFEGIP